jgi:hypothetical protein
MPFSDRLSHSWADFLRHPCRGLLPHLCQEGRKGRGLHGDGHLLREDTKTSVSVRSAIELT